jgi:hypothetical protein
MNQTAVRPWQRVTSPKQTHPYRLPSVKIQISLIATVSSFRLVLVFVLVVEIPNIEYEEDEDECPTPAHAGKAGVFDAIENSAHL